MPQGNSRETTELKLLFLSEGLRTEGGNKLLQLTTSEKHFIYILNLLCLTRPDRHPV